MSARRLTAVLVAVALQVSRADADPAGVRSGPVAVAERIDSAADALVAGDPVLALRELDAADALLQPFSCASQAQHAELELWRIGALLMRGESAQADLAARRALAVDPGLTVDLGRFGPSIARLVDRAREGPTANDPCAMPAVATVVARRPSPARRASRTRSAIVRAELIPFAARRIVISVPQREFALNQRGAGIAIDVGYHPDGSRVGFAESRVRFLRQGNARVVDSAEMLAPEVDIAGWLVDGRARAGGRLSVLGGRLHTSAFVGLAVVSDRPGDGAPVGGATAEERLEVFALNRVSVGGGAAAAVRITSRLSLAVDGFAAVGRYLQPPDAPDTGQAPVTMDGSFAARWALTGDWQLSSAVELGWLGVHRPGETDGAGPTDYVETTASIALSAARRW